MKPPRLTINRLMAVVALVAINLGAVRALIASGPQFLIGALLALLGLQVAVFGLISSRGPSRTFWAGFLAFGAAALVSFFWDMGYVPGMSITRAATIGDYEQRESAGSPWPLRTVWTRCGVIAADFLEALPNAPLVIENRGDVILGITYAVILFLPQLLLALVGGLLAWSLAKVARGSRVATPAWPPSRRPLRRVIRSLFFQ
jgi:hypothetical protein